jgi:hypothetical protein
MFIYTVYTLDPAMLRLARFSSNVPAEGSTGQRSEVQLLVEALAGLEMRFSARSTKPCGGFFASRIARSLQVAVPAAA